MKDIITNMYSPSWWFTGIFFIFVGLLISKLVQSWIPSLLGYLSAQTTFIARGQIRRFRIRYKKLIKSLRFDDVLVLREIIKGYIFLALFLLSILIAFSTITSLSIGFELSQEKLNTAVLSEFSQFLICAILLVYILQILYLLQAFFVKKLLLHRGRVRIRNQSNSSLKSGRKPIL